MKEERAPVNWQEIYFATEQSYFDIQSLIEKASDEDRYRKPVKDKEGIRQICYIKGLMLLFQVQNFPPQILITTIADNKELKELKDEQSALNELVGKIEEKSGMKARFIWEQDPNTHNTEFVCRIRQNFYNFRKK